MQYKIHNNANELNPTEFTLSYMYGVHVRRACAMNVKTVAHVRRACATWYTSHVHARRTCTP